MNWDISLWRGVWACSVERFSVGFGPVVFSRVINGVQIAVSAFPLGGYVKMGGDDPRDRAALKPGDFFAAAWWRRVLIALAGPGANFVLAIVVSIVLAWVGVRLPDAPNVIGAVTAGSAADSVGLRAEDRLTSVDDTPVGSLQAFYQEVGGASRQGSERPRHDFHRGARRGPDHDPWCRARARRRWSRASSFRCRRWWGT